MKFNEAGKIRKMQAQMQKAAENAVSEMANIAQKHFMENFRKQGFDDRVVEKWQPRKRTERSRLGQRGILIGKGTGVLRRSINKRKLGKYTALIYIIGNANKYAKVHNDGLRAGRGKGFKMPKRQFIGDSYNMDKKIREAVNQRLMRVFK